MVEEANGRWLAMMHMPTVLRHGPYRLYFYSNEADEPVHVNVERDGDVAKFWLEPVQLARSSGFRAAEINRISKLVGERREEIMEAWNGHFGR